MAVSPDTLAAQLAEAGLVPQAELAALREQHQPADAEALARLLVKLKVLTAYQAQQAYAGKSKALVLGNYVVLDKLGQGGMGMVLKARHRRMNRIVALKVLSPAVTRTPDAMRRFQREVEAAAKLHHPHIVTAHDADEVNGTHFLVMEYVEGTDLSVLVKKKGPLPVDQVVNCMLQAARGLEYAHRHGVIHRDIKPANLLLDKEGTIKVLDMGLARIEGETGANAELTSTGAVMGTVDYMAPEQALSTKSADARSDIYSLGISLWYLLIGRPVFEGDSLMARLIAHRETPPPSLKGARGEVPAALDALFQKMIAKKPADRCQSMTEVIAALETCRLPQTSSEKSTPSFTTGPSEQTKLSEFMGLFGGGADPSAATRTVEKDAKTAPAESAYEATVTSGQPSEGTDPQTLTSIVRPMGARTVSLSPWWRRRPNQIGLGIAALFALTLGMVVIPSRPNDPKRGPLQGQVAGVAIPQPSSPNTDPTVPAPASPVVPSKGQIDAAAITSGVELDGIDDYIDLTSDWAYDGGPVTVELWTTPGVPALVEACTTLLHSETPANPLDHPLKFCYLHPSSQVANDGELHLGRPPDDNVAAATYQIRPGVRTHLAAVFDGKESTFFVDGRPLPRKIFLYSWPKHEGERFTWIGAARSSENEQTSLSQFWTGIIHSFRISSNARYTAEFKPPVDFRVDPATEGLYLFDEGAGSNAKDSSGHERHGKIIGGRWAAPGQLPASGPVDSSPGSCLHFDGSTAFVEVPTLRFDGTRPITLEAWVLSEIQTKESIPAAVLGWSAGATLYRNPTDASYRFHCWGPEGEEAAAHAGVARESRQLHHVAGVWDGTTLRTFFDGKPGQVQQVDLLFAAIRDSDGVKDKFCIGATSGYGTGNRWDKGEFFKGFIDEVRISQTARYTGEFTPAKRFEPDADSLALLHFDEGSGTEVRDTSGHGHHGKVVGAKWFTAKTPTTARMASTASAPPTPAMAPFSAEQARIHQDAWAAHLQVPVEKTNSIGMKFRLIPPGEYEQGQGEGEAAAALAAAAHDRNWQERIRGEAPRHRVRLTQPFFLSTTEVTQEQFLEVTGRNPSYFSSSGPGKDVLVGGDSQSLPVENVSWRDVAEFCGGLSRREGLAVFDFDNSAQPQPGAGYQLPSEAQWEFACRAGTTTRYGCGDSDEKLSSVAWFSANSEKRTHPVGQLAANNFGLFDLHGNVWELMTDSWDVRAYEAFKSSIAVDPRGPNPPGAERVVRGGDRLDPSVACRSAHRGATMIGGTDPRIGFRVILSVEAVKTLSPAAVPAR